MRYRRRRTIHLHWWATANGVKTTLFIVSQAVRRGKVGMMCRLTGWWGISLTTLTSHSGRTLKRRQLYRK